MPKRTKNITYMPVLDRGTQRIFGFTNGYGASVVCHPHSYGGKEGLFELAVLHNGGLCYSTPVADDVLGYLTEDDVQRNLAAIARLPKKK